MAEKTGKRRGIKGCCLGLVAAGALLVLGVVVMGLLGICPPKGPWPAPPWCEGGISVPLLPGQAAEAPTPAVTAIVAAVEPTPLPTPAGPKVEICGKFLFDDPADAFLQPTVLGFAGTAGPDVNDIELAHQNNMKYIYQVSLWQDDRWHSLEELPENLKQAYVEDLDGNPVIIQEDFIYLNLLDPAWQEQILQDMFYKLDNGADGIVVDELSGAAQAVWLGGGFEEVTQAGFREFLAVKYSEAELADKGIPDIGQFHYRDYLVSQGQAEAYRQGRVTEVPLGLDFREFLQAESAKFIQRVMQEAHRHASAELGREIIVSANLHPFSGNDRQVTYTGELDLFTYEHSYFEGWWRNDDPQAARLDYGYPVAPPVKYARGLGKDSSILMILRDYSLLRDMPEPAASRRVAHAMAETFISGGTFCYWDFETAYANEGPYSVDRQTIRPYYDFLHEYPQLFLDAAPVKAEVAVIAPPRVDWADQAPNDAAAGFAWMLLESNIPFDFTTPEKASEYRVVFASGYSWSDTEAQALLDYMDGGGVVIAGDDRFATLDENFQPAQRDELASLKAGGERKHGQGSLYFFAENIGWNYHARRQPADLERVQGVLSQYVQGNQAPANTLLAPWEGDGMFVLHALNNDYDQDYLPRQDLPIRARLPGGFDAAGKTLSVIQVETGEVTPVEYTTDDGWLEFTLPALDVWSVAVLQ